MTERRDYSAANLAPLEQEDSGRLEAIREANRAIEAVLNGTADDTPDNVTSITEARSYQEQPGQADERPMLDQAAESGEVEDPEVAAAFQEQQRVLEQARADAMAYHEENQPPYVA